MTLPFCTDADVEKRLRRFLTPAEKVWTPGMIAEAQALALAELGCPPERFDDEVPEAITLVTSRMVARVIQEDETVSPDTFGATQVGITAGSYTMQSSFLPGTRTGAPWVTKVDRAILEQFSCKGKAFAVDTLLPRTYSDEEAEWMLLNTDLGWTPLNVW